MHPLRLLQSHFGFTRNEITVVVFLGTTFVAGSVIRMFRSGDAQGHPGEIDYARSDSIFLARSNALNPGAAGGRDSAAHPSHHLRRVNPNTAPAAELERLPGIGPALAQRIIAYRGTHGAFRTLDDLRRVKGIGPRTLEHLRPALTLATGTQQESPAGRVSGPRPARPGPHAEQGVPRSNR